MIDIDINKKLHGANGDMDLNVNLKIKQGDFIALAGQSGSGKTTLLRILAGLEDAKGTIKVGDEVWLKGEKCLASQKRKIGFVFQDYALFTNMSVLDNLLYVQKDKELADKLLKMTELNELKDRLPNTLSGGQKQRVSLCRAMMNRPKLLLMDEPLSALDPSMRTKLQNEILTLHKEFETTTIVVSHDPSEIYRLANRVVILNLGKIINDGNSRDVLLKTKESTKFAFEGELLDIIRVDVINIAIISIGQQLIEVVISDYEINYLKLGQSVNVSTKACSPILTYSP